jgi:hypothetical protein
MKERKIKKYGKYTHIKRLLFLYFGILILFIIVRPFIIPKSFGKLGHFRAKSIEENVNLPIRYGNIEDCAYCHEEEYNEITSSVHKKVNCQVCHGPLASHIEEPENYKPLKRTERDFCGLCHFAVESRPSTFPQIEKKGHFPEEKCEDCHLSHNPKIE